MLAFWNRREVYAGADMAAFARRRQALADAGVRYAYRAVSAHSGERARALPGVQPAVFYYLYVHKRDYERAVHILNGRA